MALVRFNNGKPEQKIPEEAGNNLWLVLNGEVEGTSEQEEFCLTVDKIYLNWRTAPDSYIEKRQDIIFPMAIARWMVNQYGEVTRPDPKHEFDVNFANKWGLTMYGKLAPSARNYAI